MRFQSFPAFSAYIEALNQRLVITYLIPFYLFVRKDVAIDVKGFQAMLLLSFLTKCYSVKLFV